MGCSLWQGHGLAGWQEAGGQDGWHPIWVAEMELSWVTGGWWNFSGKGPTQPRELLARMVTVPQLSSAQRVTAQPFFCSGGVGGALGSKDCSSCLLSVHLSSRVRGELHLQGERGVRQAWRVPLPPRLLWCQLRHQ